MYSPETVLISRKHLYVVRHDRSDTRPRYMRWRDRFNPLRVEIVFRLGTYPNIRRIKINREGAANLWLSNLTWRLWRERMWRRANNKERRS